MEEDVEASSPALGHGGGAQCADAGLEKHHTSKTGETRETDSVDHHRSEFFIRCVQCHSKTTGSYTMFLSSLGSRARTRWKPRRLRFSVVKFPSRISSATERPTAGECCRPWPLKPVAKYMLLTSGCIPMMPFWSKVL
ncbi:hypothetical protein EYF80_045881 [Liparis tanakae]|uniref:Uncharacterized protein n=1 Tax=Liparis tanakae TaxID=230148 RepID=A0A4Z2FRY3_9TELE|nr:hypothetical protein EYF80_045881 [Liparis tanakae]